MQEEVNNEETSKPEEESLGEINGEIISALDVIDIKINHSLHIIRTLGDLPEDIRSHTKVVKLQGDAFDILRSGVDWLKTL